MKKIAVMCILTMLTMLCSINVTFADENIIAFSDISIESIDAVENDLNLVLEKDGWSISWSSSNETIEIDGDIGKVNRPYPDDANVTLTATLTQGSTEKTEAFPIIVKAFATENEIAENSAVSLNFNCLSTEDINSVSEDLTLPSVWKNGTKVIWESNNSSLIKIVPDTDVAFKGEVNTSYFGNGFCGVKLTALVYKNKGFYEKDFYVNVKEDSIGISYSNDMISAREDFKNDFVRYNSLFELKNDVIIPSVLTDGVQIECFSEVPSAVSNTGVVTRDNNNDISLNFTVIFNRGYERSMIIFPLVVKAYNVSELSDIAMLDVNDTVAEIMRTTSLNSVMTDLTLKTLGKRGTEIVWSSSDTSVISNSGEVSRSDSDCTATLTATGSYKGYTYTQSINVIVKREISSDTSSSFGDSSGGGKITAPQTVPQTVPGDIFKDVPKTHWAYSYITKLAEKKVVSGGSDGNFRPNDNVLREEFVKMLLLSANNFEKGYSTDFSDVKADAWYYPYVAYANKNGVVNGIDDFTFGSGMNITREDAAVMIVRCLDIYQDGPIEMAFNDVDDISDYALNSVYALYKLNILNGDENNNFNPKSPATRSEIAKILCLVTE